MYLCLNVDRFVEQLCSEKPGSLRLFSISMVNLIEEWHWLREGTFFLGGGEGWGILGFFSQKSVGPPLRFNENTPDPPPLGD